MEPYEVQELVDAARSLRELSEVLNWQKLADIAETLTGIAGRYEDGWC